MVDGLWTQTYCCSHSCFSNNWDTPIVDSLLPRNVLLMIPGNPGIAEYYLPFLTTVKSQLGPKLDIIAVSYPGFTANDHVLLSLKEQVDHKIALLDLLIDIYPDNTRFFIAGHSVGAYMAHQILKARPYSNITRVISLFPTLHSMAVTPRANQVAPLTNAFVRSCLVLIVFWLSFLPSAFLLPIAELVDGQGGEDKRRILRLTVQKYLHSNVLNSALFLANNEFKLIKELDKKAIDSHQERYIMYYSKTDGWTPLEDHYELIKKEFPKVDLHLCEHDTDHAFVVSDSERMGHKVVEWLTPLISLPFHSNKISIVQ
ncbi:hypothetical protein BC833DRAFT_520839 [Globomyces pollinis-pini]|nr:hypothetical protein BC833DRAFT_520839 [Globomyces pollinis-pini]